MARSPSTKAQKTVKIQAQDEEDDNELSDLMDDFPASQQSTASSDAAFAAIVAKQYRAAEEKKKKEKEKKMLVLAEKELSKVIDKKSESFRQSVQEIDALYADFDQTYASAEDQIRKLWLLVREQQKTLLDLAERKHVQTASQAIEVEKGHLNGMASVKRACENFKTLIGSMTADED